MRSYDVTPRSPLPIPGDNAVLDKYDPDQHKHDDVRPRPRDEKPPYLTDAEWEQIRIKPGEMREQSEWDGRCHASCCEPRKDGAL